ncbi:MAG: alpha/beta fold hydrolase [Longispora sp.]|nr:alpha/beta fold hydrolase [Longispora sp. (in: high G+C Gram-positive bacteria)]
MATLPGVTIVYERRGSGSPLVLLHGIGHRWQAWDPVLDHLAKFHDVIALDLPGFGQSSRMARYDMPAFVDALAGFFDQRGLDRPHVAGSSLGGAVALELAAAGHVASTTALAPAGFWRFSEKNYALAILMFHRMLGYMPKSAVVPFLSTPRRRRLTCWAMYGRPELLDPSVPYEDLRGLRQGSGFLPVTWASRGYSYTGSPQGPVTVVWGAKDRILPRRQAERARVQLPDARHVLLPGCGHLPMHDAPDLVAQLILDTTGGAV